MNGLIGLIGLAIAVGVPVAVLVALSRTAELRRKVDGLDRRLALLQDELARRDAAAEGESADVPVHRPAAPLDRSAAVPAMPAASASSGPPPPPPAASAPPPPTSPPTSAGSQVPSQADHPLDTDWAQRLRERVRGWFTEGNVPVKVGMVVLFAGVAALLKYAADQGWMRFPIELRLAGIALVALAGLAFGWRQRHARRTFALSVQGGAIGVLLMTAFAAYKLYGLLDPLAAFIAWVVLAAAAGALAVWQEERALAVLGILAGFLAPVLMSTGSGNHVVLFSFYAVLNAAIFCIAWYRAWRELNLLGFVFTFGIGTLWGVLHYTPDKLASTLPFLALFFAFYLLLPVLHARRADGSHRSIVDGCLVFGAPLVSFAHLAALLEGDRYPLAASSLGLSVLYALLAWQPGRAHAPLLRQAHAVLAAGFATLAVPLALSAQATASVFALEGAALVWFGLAQPRPLSRWAGMILQVLAAFNVMRAMVDGDALHPVTNPLFMGTLLLSVAGFATAWCFQRAGRSSAGLGWYLWGLGWWLVMGLREIDQFLAAGAAMDARLAFAALTAALAALALRAVRSEALEWTVVAALALAAPIALRQDVLHGHPFAGTGLAAWTAFALLGAFAMHGLRDARRDAAGFAHGAWLVGWTLVIALWLHAGSTTAGLASGWSQAAFALPWLITGSALQLVPHAVAWPLQRRFNEWRLPLVPLWQWIVVASIGVVLLPMPGDAAPLPWIPLLNPLELVLAGALWLLATWFWRGPVPVSMQTWRAPVLSVALFLVLTGTTLRAVHHLGGVPWSAAMFDTALVQASLSLVWSVLGVAGWVAGSRRRQRELWLAGAVLMAVVLAKLVLVDRVHLGNLPGIASFIGYGLLCTLVGYLAPAPPRSAVQ